MRLSCPDTPRARTTGELKQAAAAHAETEQQLRAQLTAAQREKLARDRKFNTEVCAARVSDQLAVSRVCLRGRWSGPPVFCRLSRARRAPVVWWTRRWQLLCTDVSLPTNLIKRLLALSGSFLQMGELEAKCSGLRAELERKVCMTLFSFLNYCF